MKYGTLSYIVSDKGILMIKKNKREDDPNSGLFALPGGKLEDYERGLKNSEGRLESAIRETIDEANITMLNPVFRGIILFDNKDRIFPNWPEPDNYLVYIYSATEKEGELKESDEGIPVYIPEKKIPSLPKNSGDKLMYEWLKDGRNFIGVIKHKGNEIDEEGSWVDWF